MSMNFNDNQNNGKNDAPTEIASWIAIIVCLAAFWPLGLFLLFRKLSNSGRRSGSRTSTYSRHEDRDTYAGTAYHAQQKSAETKTESQRTDSRQSEPVRADSRKTEPQRNEARQSEQPAPGLHKGYQSRLKPIKHTEKLIAAVLLVLGIILFAVGASSLWSALDYLFRTSAGMDRTAVWGLVQSAFYCSGGIITFIARGGFLRRENRYKKYEAVISGKNFMYMAEIASASGTSLKATRRDIQKMVEKGYFGPTAFFDAGLDALALNADAAADARKAQESPSKQASAGAAPAASSENQYMAILSEIRAVRCEITDGLIAGKIARLEDLTAKIFRIVEENPEKLSKIKRFMDYYLPTTMKLLHSYCMLERQGIEGENIASAKQDIARILDTLVAGYEQQLDQLFQSDMLDITTDIDVLESMLAKDGLKDDTSGFKTMGGH